MKQKMILVLCAVLFVLLLGGAGIAYSRLNRQVSPETLLDLPAETGSSQAASDGEIGLAEESGEISEAASQDTTPPAPDFTMEDIDGNSVKLSELIANGKPIVLNFWASWCPPCKNEMPEFNTVFLELGEDIQFVMVDLADGSRETKEDGAAYVEEQGFSFPVYFDTKQEGAETYGIYSIPTTLFIDKDGNIITGVQGAISEDTLRKAIDLIR